MPRSAVPCPILAISLLFAGLLLTVAPAASIAAADWLPQQQLRNPVQIIVSLPEQRLTVYHGNQNLVSSPISSGKFGHDSPAGVFSILGKRRYHESNIYSNAPMPFMQRLTWSGIALHASDDVPDYPASHGCIRLPSEFAEQLYKFTDLGGHVIIANESVAPVEIRHTTLFRPTSPTPLDYDQIESHWRAGLKLPEHETVSPQPLRILITRHTGRELLQDAQRVLNRLGFDAGEPDGYMGPQTAGAITGFQKSTGLRPTGLMSDTLLAALHAAAGLGEPSNGRLYVRQDFKPLFDAPVTIAGDDKPLGSHHFTVLHFDKRNGDANWLATTLTRGTYAGRIRVSSAGELPIGDNASFAPYVPSSSAEEALGRIDIPQATRDRINRILTPGSSLAITNDGISKETTPEGTDFIVLMQ